MWDINCPNRAQSSQEDLLPTEKMYGGLGRGCLLACFFALVLVSSFLLIWFGLRFFVIYSYDRISSASEKFNSTSQSIFEAKLSISRL